MGRRETKKRRGRREKQNIIDFFFERNVAPKYTLLNEGLK